MHDINKRNLIELNDGRLAFCTTNYSIKLRNFCTNECKIILNKKQNIFVCLVELIIGWLVSGSHDGNIEIWNTITKQRINKLQTTQRSIRCLIELSYNRFGGGLVN